MTIQEMQSAILTAGLPLETFTEPEINKANCDIKDINKDAFFKLCLLRKKVNAPIRFCKNGIVAKGHKSKGHTIGTAFDIYIVKANYYSVFKYCLEVGLLKLGIYYNGCVYSYHVEDSKFAAFWSATKDAYNNWDFAPLIINPKH